MKMKTDVKAGGSHGGRCGCGSGNGTGDATQVQTGLVNVGVNNSGNLLNLLGGIIA